MIKMQIQMDKKKINSDDSDDPEDFVVEDFKEFCRERYLVGA
jgi:hypothetical protein